LGHPVPDGQFGYLRLKTLGRRSGRERVAILGYVEDGENFVTLAMNGWAEADPAWWRNLLAKPDAAVELKGGTLRPVHAREAMGDERERLWALIGGHTGYGDLDAFAGSRTLRIPVVVLEPRVA
jgi:F420H(2)-dependent quinone reductase